VCRGHLRVTRQENFSNLGATSCHPSDSSPDHD
jgi:hypothetical protein